uniref:Uncharacterized protein n=1 Tax=Arundo donax TaxID=35708 RepID=A0A0A9CAI0_ARUDO
MLQVPFGFISCHMLYVRSIYVCIVEVFYAALSFVQRLHAALI